MTSRDDPATHGPRQAGSPADTGAGDSLRELRAAREIAHAFLTGQRPAEVYQLALERVVPLLGAAFGCVFVRCEDDPELLQVVAAHNWPDAYAEYLDRMRVRVGRGPTGRAVAQAETIEVPDVFADAALQGWWEPARELGFCASISLPLVVKHRPTGAVTLYFTETEAVEESDRSLLRLVADQLAAAAEKAYLIDDLRQANRRLREQNVELEARYREAEEARRLKNEFLANVSHELRTPLTAVLGFTYLLREGLSGELSSDQDDAVEKIEQAGGSLLALINDLLDLTQLKLGRTTVEQELCDAAALTQAALSSMRAPEPAVELDVQLPERRVPIHTDPSLVMRILEKLLSNAAKFTHQGQIAVRVGPQPARYAERAAGPVVVWEVEDTGIGIAPDALELIFDEFRQVDGSATRRFGGTGLGLALARGLARRLGGDLTVRSELNRGSTFRLTLPAGVVPASRADAESPASQP